MKLLTQSIRTQLPKIYGQQEAEDPIAYVKLFDPRSSWTWYICEFDGVDRCFGLIQGVEQELGYFPLSELESLGVERDLYFTACPLSKICKPSREASTQ